MLIDHLERLDSELASKIKDWCNLAEKELEQIEKFFGQYTDHGPEHCKAMLASLCWLIPIDTVEQLNPLEIALLTLAVYHHDIGMAWDIKRQDRLMKEDPDWLAKRDELIDKFRYSKTVTDKSEETLLNLAFVEWARERHGEEARRWIEEHRFGRPEFHLESYFNYDPWRDVVELCKAHTEPTCAHLPVAEPIGPSGIHINLCFLCCALRLADICHITIDRTDPEVEKYIRFTDEYSREKWKVHQRIKGVGPGDRVIVINAKPDSPAVHRAIATIAREIKTELDTINVTLSKEQSKLTLPWISVDSETQVEIRGPYRYCDWEFALDRSKVYELLMGSKLYADNSVCIRELLQNAVDAVWGRCGSEAATRGKIVCRRYERQQDDQIFEVIEVEDNGIGMDEDIIENHLLKVPGEPFYKTARFKSEHPEAASITRTPIAQFGIGFLSNFMVANTIEIFTRYDSPHKPAEPIHIELESLDKGVVYHEPDMKHFPEGIRLGPGTCVRLWLRENLTNWTCSHKRGNWESLEEIVRYWARKIIPPPIAEEFDKTVSVLPKTTSPADIFPIRDDANGISGYVDLFRRHRAAGAGDIQVTVSGFYVENSPLRKELLGLWFPKGEIDFSGNRDFSLTVDRRSFAEFEDSKAVSRAKELLTEAALKWIRAQVEWNKDTKAKLRKLLHWNFVFDEYEEIRKIVMELPLFRVGTGNIATQDRNILEILKEESVYFYLPIQPIFSKFVMNSCKPARYFSTWYSDIIDKLRHRHFLVHGGQMGGVQVRGGLNFKFAARTRYRQTFPLHFLVKFCNAQLKFTEEGWPLVRLLSPANTAQTTGWDYLLNYETNRKDWLICSSEGGGYWINPHPSCKPGILEEREDIVGVYITRKRRHLLSGGKADGFLYPDDTVTIPVHVNGERQHKEFTIAKLGDLVHPFDRIDFWIEQFCTETNLSDEDRQELLKVFYVYEYKTDPDWSSPPMITWPEG